MKCVCMCMYVNCLSNILRSCKTWVEWYSIYTSHMHTCVRMHVHTHTHTGTHGFDTIFIPFSWGYKFNLYHKGLRTKELVALRHTHIHRIEHFLHIWCINYVYEMGFCKYKHLCNTRRESESGGTGRSAVFLPDPPLEADCQWRRKQHPPLLYFLYSFCALLVSPLPSVQCSKLLVELRSKLNSVKDETLLTLATWYE